MTQSTFTLNRFNGREVFAIANAEISVEKNDETLLLNFTAGGQLPALEKTCEDTAEFEEKPYIELIVVLQDAAKTFSFKDFVGRKFEIQEAMDPWLGDFVANFYYFKGQHAHSCFIEVLSQINPTHYRVKITAKVADVNWYDGSKPETSIVIEADFKVME